MRFFLNSVRRDWGLKVDCHFRFGEVVVPNQNIIESEQELYPE